MFSILLQSLLMLSKRISYRLDVGDYFKMESAWKKHNLLGFCFVFETRINAKHSQIRHKFENVQPRRKNTEFVHTHKHPYTFICFGIRPYFVVLHRLVLGSYTFVTRYGKIRSHTNKKRSKTGLHMISVYRDGKRVIICL